MEKSKKRLIIIDSNAVIHRAYHALPPLTTTKGVLVNAVYGFLLVFFKTIKEFQPDFIAACFDLPAPTFRHEKFKGYKAKRPPTPEKLCQQIPKVKEILNAFNVPIFEKEGFEADDIVGTLALRAAKFSIFNFQFSKKENLETIIITGDLDALQLVDKNTKVYILRKGIKDTVLYDENLVKEKFQGLAPEQILDFKALRGDPSDNIPGVKGIGEKTAIHLISQFGSLEELYQNLEEKTAEAKKVKPKLREVLLSQKEQAFFSKSLVQLVQDVPIDFNIKKSQWTGYDREKVIQVFKDLEFYSLLERLPEIKQGDKGSIIGENLKLW